MEVIGGVDKAFYLETSEKVVVQRLSGRRVCPKCGTIYHLINMPPKKEGVCDTCGAKLIQRSDDTPETLQKRLSIYHVETAPLLADYEREGVVHRIDARGTIDEVFNRMVKAIEER